MTKKIIFIVGLIIVIILVAYLLANKFGFRIFRAEFKQEWKSCNNDQDCTLVSTPGCYSCGRDAVNTKFINEYDNYRRSNTGSCWGVVAIQCMLEFKVPRCENNVCVATDKCANDSDCSDIDCSRLNSGVKSGYKPYCVENKCKCMCYGCE